MITEKQYFTLEQLFNYYNKELFANQLPDILINLGRKSGSYGFFAYGRWKDEYGKIVHEITINPDNILHRADIEMHQTLVHEMCHLWQYTFGSPGRKGYHNMEFALKMQEVGLMPSSTGKPGGKLVGQRMADYPMPEGRFKAVFEQITCKGEVVINLPYEPNHAPEWSPIRPGLEQEEEGLIKAGEGQSPKKKNKIKYTCACGFNVWGKPELRIQCLNCGSEFLPQ